MLYKCRYNLSLYCSLAWFKQHLWNMVCGRYCELCVGLACVTTYVMRTDNSELEHHVGHVHFYSDKLIQIFSCLL